MLPSEIEALKRQFSQIGARLQIGPVVEQRFRRRYEIDIRNDKKRKLECFVLSVRDELPITAQVLHTSVERRHLLLLVRDNRGADAIHKHRYLCGHDERHWFVAAVPDSIPGLTTVDKAMDALKPEAVRVAEQREGLKTKYRCKRHNKAFLRQGEWFFLPAPSLTPEDNLVHRYERLRRGGNPHVAEELCRRFGETVYVCRRYPRGVNEASYRGVLRRNPDAKAWNWQVMRANAEVYCRGRVSHPEHATLFLPFWHRVLPNTEANAPGAESLVFLD